jgi:hypothetical protein
MRRLVPRHESKRIAMIDTNAQHCANCAKHLTKERRREVEVSRQGDKWMNAPMMQYRRVLRGEARRSER